MNRRIGILFGALAAISLCVGFLANSRNAVAKKPSTEATSLSQNALVKASIQNGVNRVHRADHFRIGSLKNLVVAEDGLHIGADAAQVEASTYSGTFQSHEEQFDPPFDAMLFGVEADLDEGCSLQLEFRTKPVNGSWSEWQMLSQAQFNQTISLASRCSTAQYRLTLMASEPASNPRVRQISMIGLRHR